ncbi:MAG: energy transducer TonB [Paludibacteraceae bacterium]|nr:energy transducer TonB [Paludibacteraceae bacterium]
MRRLFSHIIGIILAVIANSCVDSNTNRPEEAPHTSTPISGKIYDENGNVLNGASVLNGDSQATTDSSGHFNINVDTIIGNRYVLRIKKDGYFDRIYSKMVSDTMDYPIQLIKKEPSDFVSFGKFKSEEGATVMVNGASVTIPKAGLVKRDGNDYNGMVNITVVYLSPSKNIYPLMPGSDLMALAANGDTTPLISYGMINVEMTDETGEMLQLKKGCEALLKYPAPEGFTVHDTIPLWYFNEENGLWVEDGYSVKHDDEYVGSVKHFTWWNCDIKLSNGAKIRCRLKNYPYNNASIYAAPDSIQAWVFNEILRSNIFANRPFSIASVQMPALKPGEILDTCISFNKIVLLDVEGKTLGNVKFKINDVIYRTDKNGSFSVPLDMNKNTTIKFQNYETETITKDNFDANGICFVVCKQLKTHDIKNKNQKAKDSVNPMSKSKETEFVPKDTNNIKENTENEWSEEKVFNAGGISRTQRFVWEKLPVNYPAKCMESGIQGVVYINITIEPDGTTSNPEIVKSIQRKGIKGPIVEPKDEDFKLLEEEAIRAVKLSKFRTGDDYDYSNRPRIVMPITFKLSNTQ